MAGFPSQASLVVAVVIVVAVVVLVDHGGHALMYQNCRSEPPMGDLATGSGSGGGNGATVAQQGSFTLSCDFNEDITSCTWSHYDPLREDRGPQTEPDILCSFVVDTPGNCHSQQRVRGQVNKRSCSISVSNSEPDDTGEWLMAYLSRLGSSGSPKPFTVSTYNMSVVQVMDKDRRPIRDLDTAYNWNDKQDKFEEGKNRYEEVELTCRASGGRPYPEFYWTINKDRLEDDDVFQVSPRQTVRQYGYQGMIKDFESVLKFTVNQKLLERLRLMRVETNPREGSFSFEIDCELEQGSYGTGYSSGGGSGGGSSGGSTGGYRESIRVVVAKSYDDGGLKASSIGIIIGSLVAIVVLVAAVALVVFAKASRRWCFEDEYSPPPQARGHPDTGVIVHQPNRDRQQHSQRDHPAQDQVFRNTDPDRVSAEVPDGAMDALTSRTLAALEKIPTSTQQDISPKMTYNFSTPPPMMGSPRVPQPVGGTSEAGTLTRDVPAVNGGANGGASVRNVPAAAPPPRPPKSNDLQYANLDRAFMNDPRNKVLPAPWTPEESYSTTEYAMVVSSKKVIV